MPHVSCGTLLDLCCTKAKNILQFSFPLWLQELYPVLWLQELLKSLFLWQNVIPNGRISRNHSTKMFFRAKLGHCCKGLGIFTSQSLTWNLKMDPWKRRFLLKTIISRFHVNLQGRTPKVHPMATNKSWQKKNKGRFHTASVAEEEKNIKMLRLFPSTQL